MLYPLILFETFISAVKFEIVHLRGTPDFTSIKYSITASSLKNIFTLIAGIPAALTT
jgi:hypothetical protein